jgi:hypothetical protein
MASPIPPVKAIQSILKLVNKRLVVDGVFGKNSIAAFESAGSVVQSTVRRIASVVGLDIDSLLRREPEGDWITEAQALSISNAASRLAGIDESYLRWMLMREPETRVENGIRYYRTDSESPSGTYKGLFQMGRPGWTDASQIRVFRIGSFDTNWNDPVQNARAAAGLVLKNIGYARQIHNYDGPFSAELIYAMHNQGHTFISSARKGGIGRYADGQSWKAKSDLKVAANQVRSTLA